MSVSLVPFPELPYELQMKTREWRNSENVAKYFKIPHISEETHKKWLESLCVENPRNIAFMVMNGDVAVGVTYFHSIDRQAKSADWGIYIYNQEMRGRGIGHSVLQQALEYAGATLGMNCLYLDVLAENTRAVRLYEGLGFREIPSSDTRFLRYRRDLV